MLAHLPKAVLAHAESMQRGMCGGHLTLFQSVLELMSLKLHRRAQGSSACNSCSTLLKLPKAMPSRSTCGTTCCSSTYSKGQDLECKVVCRQAAPDCIWCICVLGWQHHTWPQYTMPC